MKNKHDNFSKDLLKKEKLSCVLPYNAKSEKRYFPVEESSGPQSFPPETSSQVNSLLIHAHAKYPPSIDIQGNVFTQPISEKAL